MSIFYKQTFIKFWQPIGWIKTKSSATAAIARDADVGAHSLSLTLCVQLKSDVQATSTKFAYVHEIHLPTTYLLLLAFNASPSLHIYIPYPTLLPGGPGKRRSGVGGHALVSGCPEHLTIQSISLNLSYSV